MLIAKVKSISALSRFHAGTILVWAGVLTWAPFILLRAVGYRPSLLWFLPFHLLGVVGGSRLRAEARREMGSDPPRRNGVQIAGHSLILGGILVWLPYFYLRLVALSPVDVAKFLSFHLTGVLGGVALLILGAVMSRRAR